MGAENSAIARPAGRYPLLILGGEAAAMVAAGEAARRGVRTALVCRPAAEASLLEPTAFSEEIRRLQARFGLRQPAAPPEEPGIDVYPGRAVFSGHHLVSVDGRELRFRKALIAAGDMPAPDQGRLTPETLAELTELPHRLAVIGSGPEACQWAQAFRRLGSQVYLVGRGRTILPGEDPDAAEVIRNRLEREDVRLHSNCDELEFETTAKLCGVVIERNRQKEKLLVDRILFCKTPAPNTVGLDLSRAGVACSEHGIVVNHHLRTTNRRIFAAGAVCGAEFASPQAAEATARMAVRNALGFIKRDVRRLVIPRCIHTDPAVCQLGLTAAEASDAGIEFDTYRTELSEADASLPPGRREGFIAVHVRRQTGRIMGATVVAEDADELSAPLLLLMTRRWPLSVLSKVIPYRPSRLALLVHLARRRT